MLRPLHGCLEFGHRLREVVELGRDLPAGRLDVSETLTLCENGTQAAKHAPSMLLEQRGCQGCVKVTQGGRRPRLPPPAATLPAAGEIYAEWSVRSLHPTRAALPPGAFMSAPLVAVFTGLPGVLQALG